MGLPSFSVKRPVTISMIFVAAAIIGIVMLSRMPVELMPNTSFGQISIITNVRGGMPPADVETLVTKPIEAAVSSVSHMESLMSVSKEGESTVILRFKIGTDMDYASLETREKLNAVKKELPRSAEKPVIAQFEQNDVPIVNISVTSTRYTIEKLRALVEEDIVDNFKRVNGVANVDIGGGKPRKIVVDLDKVRMVAHNVSLQNVIGAITGHNLSMVAGNLEQNTKNYSLRVFGIFDSVDQIKKIPIILSDSGSVVRVRDIAKVQDTYLDAKEYARINIKPVVNLYVQKESTANTISVANDVSAVVDRVKENLPKGVDMYITSNHAVFIEEAIGTVTSALWQGGLLAMIVLYMFLRKVKPTLIIALSIPTSVVITFILMYMNKITINVMTLSGLALGIGMLVDNAIVVLENIEKKMYKAKNATEAVILGSEEVTLAIIASTITTVVVFLPIVFVSPQMKQLYGGLALTVSYSLFASLFVAVSLIPMLASRKSREDVKPKEESASQKAESTSKIFSRILTSYKKLLILMIRYKGRLFFVCAVFLGIAIFFYTKIEKEYLGSTKQDKFTIFIELPTGARIEQSDKAVRRIEKVLKEVPEIQLITSRVEGWSSKIYVQLVPALARKRSAKDIIEALRPKVTKIPHAFVHFQEDQQVGTTNIVVEIYGFNYKVLREIATSFATRFGTIPGFTDTKVRMREGRPELGLVVDRDRAFAFNMRSQNVGDEVHGLMKGFRASKFREGAKNIEIMVRLEESYRKTFKDLHQLPIRSGNNTTIILDQVVDFSFGLGPSEIWRKNKNRMVQVSSRLDEISLGKAVELARESVADVRLPDGYFFRFGGDYEKLQEASSQFVFIVVLVLILVYLVLGALFESYTQPFIIMVSVPLALIGAIFALYITGKKIGVGVMIGLMMLAGIVVNNAIILIDHINLLVREKQVNPIKAAIRSGLDRIRPIFMTAETTVLGLLPMAMDKSNASNLWSPLAVTVIGGLTLSTFLTLIVVPCVYISFYQTGIFLGRLDIWGRFYRLISGVFRRVKAPAVD